MKVVVFGATGGTGRELVGQALTRGHEVTAVARDPAAVAARHERLRVVRGDVTSAESVAHAIAGQEGVISAVGPRRGTPPGTLISDAVRFILDGMRSHGARRLVLESGLMVGEARGLNALQRIGVALFRARNRALYRDKVIAEQRVRESDVEWVIVRPPIIAELAPRGSYRAGVDLDVKLEKMSSRDVADALLDALTDEKRTRQILEISY